MMKYSCTVINNYLSQQLLPHLWKAIEKRQIERKVQRHMPHAISKHMLIDLLDSTTKNSSLLNKSKNNGQFKPIHEQIQGSEAIKVRMKKSKRSESAYLTIDQTSHQQKQQEHSPLSPKNIANNSLIKLPNINQNQSQEVITLRKMKERMRRFQQQINQRGNRNHHSNEESARKKKSVHSQCKYHTYDYETNIVPIDLQTFIQNEEKQKPTLLESLKINLDKQIQDQRIKKRLSQIQSRHKNFNLKVPSNKIQKIQSNPEISSKINKSQLQASPLKPLYKFQLSNVQSLSKEFEKYIENGVKMVTCQERIIKQTQNPEGPRFVVKKQQQIHEKLGSPKQKTLSSQSIIYSLQKNLKGSYVKANISDPSESITKKYQSLQLERQQRQSKISQYYLANPNYKQIKSTLNTPATYDFKLPQIKFNRQARRLQQKRTATEQKMIKGLDHIEIQIKSPHKNTDNSGSQRSGLFSAFSVHKKTESSADQLQFDKFSLKKKRSLIKDYFNNYGNQFRFKRESLIEKISVNS